MIRMVKNLEIINDVMEKTDITLNISGDDLKYLNEMMNRDPDPSKRAVDYKRKTLKRSFLDARKSLDLGGRFYGPWYQGIPKEFRRKILINGFPVMEPDFSGYHPNMLYALNKIPAPSDEVYQLDGDYPKTKTFRKFLKRFLITIVNCKDESAAMAAIRDQIRKDKRKAERWGKPYEPLGIEPLTNDTLKPIMDKLMERHAGISNYFFKDYGNKLQYYDSQIAEKILLHFARKGIACLPVHDSFIIDFRYAFELQLKMMDFYKQEFGPYIDIKVDMAQFYREFVDIILTGLDSKAIPEEDLGFWQNQYDKLSKMDLSLMPDRQIISPRN